MAAERLAGSQAASGTEATPASAASRAPVAEPPRKATRFTAVSEDDLRGRRESDDASLRQWLLDPRAGALFDILRSPDGLLANYIDPAELDALLDRQRSGQEDATDRIWRLLTLQLWGDMFLTGKREERWEGLMATAGPALSQLHSPAWPPTRSSTSRPLYRTTTRWHRIMRFWKVCGAKARTGPRMT